MKKSLFAVALLGLMATTWVTAAMGQTAPALELATATAAKYPDIYGGDHPYNYGCAGNLAVLRRLALASVWSSTSLLS